jgi:hypothetical protein
VSRKKKCSIRALYFSALLPLKFPEMKPLLDAISLEGQVDLEAGQLEDDGFSSVASTSSASFL